MALDLFVDIENSAGVRQGSGPIASVSKWRYTARMDKAGVFNLEMPASDPKAILIQRKRIARAYALMNGQRIEVGAGIIDRIEKRPQPDGTVILAVSGDCLVRELNYRSVRNLKLYSGGSPVTHAAALAAVGGYAPAGWSFTPDGSPPNDAIYGYFNGETVLAGVRKIAEKSQNHFYRGSGRSLTFASSFTPSGVRAIQARDNLTAQTCAITKLTEQIDTYDLITRIYPRGSGNADVQLTLRATNRSAPPGYTLNAAQNYIENDAATAEYGLIERQIDFRDIGPVENTSADVQAAANMLFDAALETLRRQSEELEQATYTLQVAGCSQLLRPMQSIRVVYRDATAGLNINADLGILEATWQADQSGLYTTDLVVSSADRWPQTDVGTLADSIAEGRIYQALPQLSANSYVTAYNKLVDETETAAFRFRLGNEVTQLQQVLFEFQLLPLESSVRAVGGASSGSGDIPTSAPSTPDTGSGGNNETGVGGTTSTASGGTTNTDLNTTAALATGDNVGGAVQSGGPTTTGSQSLEANLGGSGDTVLTGSGNTVLTGSGNTGSPSTNETGSPSTNASGGPSTNASSTPSTNASGSPSTNSSSGPSSNSTGAPTGGDVISAGRHNHGLGIEGGTFGAGWYSLYYDEGSNTIKANGLGYNPGVLSGTSGDHTHDISNHTHDLNSHTHSLNNHTHDLGNHTHSLNNHTHNLGSHTHTLSSHTHSIGSHTHTLGQHTHSISAHTHSISAHTHSIDSHTHDISQHTHTIAAHNHSIAAHTHSLSQHTHSLNNHTHDLSDSITAIYGIFREESANTFALADLEYRVNSGSWLGLETSVDAGDGWRRLDITAQLQDSTTFRPLQESNTLEIRRKTSGATDKTAQIDAQLSVRSVVQAIAYA